MVVISISVTVGVVDQVTSDDDISQATEGSGTAV